MSSPSTASLSVGRGLGVGPASTSPVGEKTPAWHGQKKRVLSGSHLMIQPRCVQTRERPWYVPSWSCRSVLGVSWYSKSTTLPKGVNSLVDATRTRVAASAWTVGKASRTIGARRPAAPNIPLRPRLVTRKSRRVIGADCPCLVSIRQTPSRLPSMAFFISIGQGGIKNNAIGGLEGISSQKLHGMKVGASFIGVETPTIRHPRNTVSGVSGPEAGGGGMTRLRVYCPHPPNTGAWLTHMQRLRARATGSGCPRKRRFLFVFVIVVALACGVRPGPALANGADNAPAPAAAHFPILALAPEDIALTVDGVP